MIDLFKKKTHHITMFEGFFLQFYEVFRLHMDVVSKLEILPADIYGRQKGQKLELCKINVNCNLTSQKCTITLIEINSKSY